MTFHSKIKILFFIVGYLLITLGFSPVAFALDPNKTLTQYVHEVWQDELPQNTIHSITQTKDGYIWLATYEGLVRFDGVSIQLSNKAQTNKVVLGNRCIIETKSWTKILSNCSPTSPTKDSQ